VQATDNPSPINTPSKTNIITLYMNISDNIKEQSNIKQTLVYKLGADQTAQIYNFSSG
jgi:1,4-dihydroxy-2-naphthoate octaprenyltransferase